MVGFFPAEAHEDKRRDLEAADHDLDARARVPAANPRVFLVRDLVEVAADRDKELVAEFDRAVFPVDLLGRRIEGVVGKHLERGQVPPGLPDRVKVIEPDAGLGDGERVRGRRDDAGGHERLEISDGCDGEIDIVPPACGHRVALDAGMPVLFKKGKVGFAHLVDRMAGEHGIPDEGVGFAGCIPAHLAGTVARPEGRTAGFADLPCQPLILKIFELVFFFEH